MESQARITKLHTPVELGGGGGVSRVKRTKTGNTKVFLLVKLCPLLPTTFFLGGMDVLHLTELLKVKDKWTYIPQGYI